MKRQGNEHSPCPIATRPAAVLLLVATRPADVLLLVRYSSSGRPATRPLLVQRRAATRPLLVQRPCRYPPGRLFVCLDIPTQASCLQLLEATAVLFY